MAKALNWVVWTYALRPGWERSGEYDSREEARLVRDELISFDGYDPEWVRIRHQDALGEMRRPSRRSITDVRHQIARADELELLNPLPVMGEKG